MENNDFKLEDLLEPNKCEACGEIVPRGTMFCPNCGAEIKKKEEKVIANSYSNYQNTSLNNDGVVKPINKWLAFILCLFFGFFGFHKFYEGNKKMGLIYFFTVGLFGFGWIVDIFVILFKPNPYYVTR